MFFKKLCRTLVLSCFVFLTSCNIPFSRVTTPSPETIQIQVEATSKASEIIVPTEVLLPPTVEPTARPVYSMNHPLAVVSVIADDFLSVHSSPGIDTSILAQLAANALNLQPTGFSQWIDNQYWVEIKLDGGLSGWVQADQITPHIDSAVFCNDSRVPELINQFITAVKNRDENLLLEIISPIHGVEIRHEWWNPPVKFPYYESLLELFDDTASYEWGILQGSGDTIQGSFQEVILPLLDDVTTKYSQHCNYLEQGLAAGGTAGFSEWPFEYSNMNYYSIYRSAEAGDELNWRTWAIGFVYVDEQPYIAILVQYHWEL